MSSAGKARAAETRSAALSEGVSVSLASAMLGEGEPLEGGHIDGQSLEEREREQAAVAARKLDFAAAPPPPPPRPPGQGHSESTPLSQGQTQPETSSDTSFGLHSSASWSRLSVREELLAALNGEKQRVSELTAKINELYRLEEEQRSNARDMAIENDRLEGIRDILEEQLRATQLLNEELENQSELKDDRARELEQSGGRWMAASEQAAEELYRCRGDVGALMDEAAEHCAQRDAAVSQTGSQPRQAGS
jgi:hypothetical protein